MKSLFWTALIFNSIGITLGIYNIIYGWMEDDNFELYFGIAGFLVGMIGLLAVYYSKSRFSKEIVSNLDKNGE